MKRAVAVQQSVVLMVVLGTGAMMCPRADTGDDGGASGGSAGTAADGGPQSGRGASGAGTSSTGGAGSSVGGGSTSSTGASGGTSNGGSGGVDGGPAQDCFPDLTVDAGRPAIDPAPCLNDVGAYTFCAGAVTNSLAPAVLMEGAVTSYTFSGTVTGSVGNGTFYARGASQEEITGTIPTGLGGSYAVTVPLFCGSSLVKLVWENAGCRSVFVYRVETGACMAADIRATLVWDEAGRDWELHLIRPGGRLNDTAGRSDCTWNTCRTEPYPEWGAPGAEGNPRKDVDDVDTWGPENIFLSAPEDGTYHVMVEHWGSGEPTSDGTLILNVRGKLFVLEKLDLASRQVWLAATIEWPSGTVTPSQAEHTCLSWAAGCQDVLP